MIILSSDWKTILKKAWSIRLMAVASALSGVEIAMPMLDGVLDMPRGMFAGLSGIVTAAAFVSRLVAQRSMNDADAITKD